MLEFANEFEYSLYYSLYEADQELLNKLSVLNIKMSGPISESSYIVLQESVKDTIMNYIRKITANIQNVWNRFKSKMIELSGNNLIKGNDKYLNSTFVMNPPKDFEIPDLNNLNIFLNKKIQPYSAALNEKLNNVDDFLKEEFTEYFTSDDFVKGVMDKVIKKATGEEKINAAQIKIYTTYLTDTYKKSYDSIASDLQKINESAKTIERLLSGSDFNTPVDVVNKPQPNQNNNGDQKVGESFSYHSTMMNYFSEAEDDNKKEDSDNKFRNADPNAQQEEKQNDKNKEVVTYVRNYYKAMTKVLSLKMQVCSRCYNKVYMITKKYIDLQKAADKEAKKEEKKPTENTNKENSPENKNNDNQIDI